jgi:hypothetical protein
MWPLPRFSIVASNRMWESLARHRWVALANTDWAGLGKYADPRRRKGGELEWLVTP